MCALVAVVVTASVGCGPVPDPAPVRASSGTPGESATARADAVPSPEEAPAYVTGVSEDGRYLLDQAGAPVLVQGDSPWSALARASVAEWSAYCESRGRLGYNLAILDLVVLPDGGRGNPDGATDDGLVPFEDLDDWTTPSSDYWDRVDEFVRIAAEHGITVMLVPAYASDGSGAAGVLGRQPSSTWERYGAFLGDRFRDAPNVVWAMGGDFPREVWDELSPVYEGVHRGVVESGDDHLWTAHLSPHTSTDPDDEGFRGSTSVDNRALASIVDLQFVYTYQPPYAAVRRAVAQDAGPVLFGEGAYVGENNNGGDATTAETLRRQSGWTLTSGAAGDILGTQDWWFPDGWSDRLDDYPELTERAAMHDVLRSVEWWTLRPVDGARAVVSGLLDDVVTGSSDDGGADVLESDVATVASSDDRTLTVVYLPTARRIELDPSVVPENAAATWYEAATGTPAEADPDDLEPPGDGDWLLVLSAAAG